MTFQAFGKVLSHVLFLILFWMRKPLRLALKAVSLAAGICAAGGFLGHEKFADFSWLLTAASFLAAASLWWLDSALIRLAPQGTVIGHRWR